MCMKIDKSIKPKNPNKDGFCVGWKVVTGKNKSPFSHTIPRVHIYTIGENFSSYNENDYNSGFHLLYSRKEARGLINYNKSGHFHQADGIKIIKVFFKPEDVMGYGTCFLYDDAKSKTIVVKKLTIKSLNRVS